MLAWVVVIIISLLVFYKVKKNTGDSTGQEVDPETAKEAALSEGLTEREIQPTTSVTTANHSEKIEM